MNKISIVSVGNELLNGECVDTNRAWLGKELSCAGFCVVSGFTVADEIDEIKDTIKGAAIDADVVIVTGGLGPTDDDLTRAAIAKFLGVDLEYRSDLYAQIESYFSRRKYKMTEKNKVQAYIPRSAEPLLNPVGTAPGFFATKDDVLIAAMPGVPSEMKEMFANKLLPILIDRSSGDVFVSKRVKCYGIGESNLNEKLGDLLKRGQNPLVNCTVNDSIITLHVIAHAEDSKLAHKMVSKKISEIEASIGEFIFGFDDDTLVSVLARELTERGQTIATAESCTGGLIAKMLTDVPGASEYFNCGFVTYSNNAKESLLGIDGELIAQKGAVSREVAMAMANGALHKSGSDIAIAVTGIAGPTGGSPDKPLGLVFISVATKSKVIVEEYNFAHSRSVFRARTALKAIDMARKVFSATV